MTGEKLAGQAEWVSPAFGHRDGDGRTPDSPTQRIAARIAEFTLLLLMTSRFLGMFAFGRHHPVAGNAAATAQEILAHERGFQGKSLRLLGRRLPVEFRMFGIARDTPESRELTPKELRPLLANREAATFSLDSEPGVCVRFGSIPY